MQKLASFQQRTKIYDDIELFLKESPKNIDNGVISKFMEVFRQREDIDEDDRRSQVESYLQACKDLEKNVQDHKREIESFQLKLFRMAKVVEDSDTIGEVEVTGQLFF